MKTTKLLCSVLVICLVFTCLLTACEQKTETAESTTSETATTGTDTEETIVLKLASHMPVDHAFTTGLEEFAQQVLEDSNGRLDCQQ